MPPVRVEQTADKSNFALFAEEAERNRTGAGVRANDGADGVDADVHLRQLLHQHLAQLLGIVHRIGVQDQFGHSGPAWELLEQFGLRSDAIIAAVKELV